MSTMWPMLCILGLLISQAGSLLVLVRLQQRLAESESRELLRDRGLLP